MIEGDFAELPPKVQANQPARSKPHRIQEHRAQQIARQNAVSEWFLEASVLLMIFPIIDQLLRERSTFNWRLTIGSAVVSLCTGLIGLYLRRGE